MYSTVVSDVGTVRSNNQDSAFAGEHLIAICDGMGGHAGGDTASARTGPTLRAAPVADGFGPRPLILTGSRSPVRPQPC